MIMTAFFADCHGTYGPLCCDAVERNGEIGGNESKLDGRVRSGYDSKILKKRAKKTNERREGKIKRIQLEPMGMILIPLFPSIRLHKAEFM